MKKNWTILVFKAFSVLAMVSLLFACQEDEEVATLPEKGSLEKPKNYTFIYDGVEYSAPTLGDMLLMSDREYVLKPNFVIYASQESGDTYHVYNSLEECKKNHKSKAIPQVNSKAQGTRVGSISMILYLNKNTQNGNPDRHTQRYHIYRDCDQGEEPCISTINNLGRFDNAVSSLTYCNFNSPDKLGASIVLRDIPSLPRTAPSLWLYVPAGDCGGYDDLSIFTIHPSIWAGYSGNFDNRISGVWISFPDL
ncbi:hypothetical protein [Tunicatimonas pelagia]|uniref:hypothetical protein n=1 Tax=Tunicatimonas pelagia TaxID=931531 RepID=UPI0026657CD4|nr:hypothetical protein [Tunicatimonas pelagia]WKN40733.1 hypothetical protein P0M28_16975 [Tunicatimonas pelagia]